MHKSWLASLLAVGVLGLPSPKDTDTQKSVKASQHDLWLCDRDNFDAKAWEKVGMDSWVETFALPWPHGANGIDADKSKSYMRHVANQAKNIGQLDCEVGDCHVTFEDADACRKYGDGIVPIAYFHVQAMVRFVGWAEALIRAIDEAGERAVSGAPQMAAKFTDHDISDDDTALNLAIAGGVFGVLGSLPGVGKAADSMGSIGGLLSLESTITGPTTNEAAMVVQDEVHQFAQVMEGMSNVTYAAKKGIRKWANNIVTEPLKEHPLDQKNGWVKLLKGGAFADNSVKSWKTNEKQEKLLSDQFNAFAINSFWQLDQVFIVKAQNIRGDLTKEYSKEHLKDMDGVCEDGDCYFFVKAQPFQNMLDGDWKSVKGWQDLGDYGLRAIDIARAAERQHKRDGKIQAKPPTAENLLDVVNKEKDTAGKLWISLPFIDYDDDVDSTSKIFHEGNSFGSPTDHSHFISTLHQHVPDIENWPYDEDLS